jgi:hypothetical protein
MRASAQDAYGLNWRRRLGWGDGIERVERSMSHARRFPHSQRIGDVEKPYNRDVPLSKERLCWNSGCWDL